MNAKPLCRRAPKFAAALWLMALSAAPAQIAVEAWVQHYSHPIGSDDHARKVLTDDAGNVIVAGYTENGTTGQDFLIIKYSGAGVALWTNRYDGPVNTRDIPAAIAVDGSGDVFVTGGSDGSGSSSDYATIKYSGAGVPLWTNRYDGPGHSLDYANGIRVDGSGNVFVTGQSVGSGSSYDYATIKYSSGGVPLWTNRYNALAGGNDEATAITVDPTGNVFVTGSSRIDSSLYDYATVAYSGAGLALWTNRYNGPGDMNDYASAIAVDGSGNVFVTGYSWSGSSPYDYATVAYSGVGVPLWTNRYNGPGNYEDVARAVAVDGSGNVFVTGYSASTNVYPYNYFDYATVAYSAAGVPLWTNRYNGLGNGYDHARGLAVDGSGNVFVTGRSANSNDFDFATVAYSGAGVPLWTNLYNGPANSGDEANAIAVDSSGSVLVTGSSWSGTSDDYATIKYSGAGVPLWTSRHDGMGNSHDSAAALAVDGSGNVFVTGGSRSGSFRDYATVKYSDAGVPVWTNRYNAPADGDCAALAIAVDGSGNVFVTGVSSDDYATISYSGPGVPLWTNRYNGPADGRDVALAIAVDGSGNVFVTGHSTGSDSSSDYATIKYSGAGVPLWTNRYNARASGSDTSVIAVDGSGDVFVSGRSTGSGSFGDYATIKYSGAGLPLWTNRYNGPGNSTDVPSGIAVDGRADVFVTGRSTGSGSFGDYATIKYSSAGVPLWTNRYNGPENYEDVARAVAVDRSGNVFVTGYSFTAGNSPYYATLAYSGAGVPLWTNRYNPPRHYDYARGLAVDGSGNVFVTGESWSGGSSDYATIAYSGTGVPLWTNRYNRAGNSSDAPSGIAVDGMGNVFVTGTSRIGTSSDYATIKYSSRRPHLTIEPTGSSYFLRVTGLPGSIYRLERATTVTGTWHTISMQTSSTSGRMEYRDSSPPPNQAFYRVREE